MGATMPFMDPPPPLWWAKVNGRWLTGLPGSGRERSQDRRPVDPGKEPVVLAENSRGCA